MESGHAFKTELYFKCSRLVGGGRVLVSVFCELSEGGNKSSPKSLSSTTRPSTTYNIKERLPGYILIFLCHYNLFTHSSTITAEEEEEVDSN